MTISVEPPPNGCNTVQYMIGFIREKNQQEEGKLLDTRKIDTISRIAPDWGATKDGPQARLGWYIDFLYVP